VYIIFFLLKFSKTQGEGKVNVRPQKKITCVALHIPILIFGADPKVFK